MLMISVIVPVYRVEPYLRQCVDSILNQTYRNLEVLLIDDGSPDRCGEICDEYGAYDDRVRVFHTENRGLSAARNLGLKEAKGEYIGFVDSDDWIEPDMYDVLLRKMLETGAEISVCGIWYEYKNLKEELHFKEGIYTGQNILCELADGNINAVVWNKLFRKQIIRSIVFPEGRNSEDIAVIHLIVQKAKTIALIPTLEYHYRMRFDSITKTNTAKNLIDHAEAHFDRFYYFKDQHPELFIEKYDKLLLFTAIGISKMWRWWFGCSSIEKNRYKNMVNEYKLFVRAHYPLFGCINWSTYLRFSAFFMRFDCWLSFAVLYWINQLFKDKQPEMFNYSKRH